MKLQKQLFISILLSFICVAQMNAQGLKAFKLKNGMSVFVWEDSTKTDVLGQVAVRTGSVNDPEQYTGLAHYLEHVLFKGTQKIGALDWAKEQPLYEALSEFLYRYAAIDLNPDYFENVRRPGHLVMKLAVMNDERRILAIHTEMPDRTGMGSQLSAAVPGVRKHISAESTLWPAKELLPEHILLKGDEEKYIFPALKAGANGVSSQVFLKENEARLRHNEALIRLYRIHHKQQVDYFTRKWSFSDGMKLSWFVSEGTRNAASDMTDAAILNSFPQDPWTIRSAEKYEVAAEKVREELGRVAYEMEKKLAELYKMANECENLLSRVKMDELREHYDLLFAPGFLRREEVWNNDYKRFLKGLKLRAERALTARGKDQEKAQKIDDLLERLFVELSVSDMKDDADLHDLWALSEECRLAVFAPEVPLKIRNPLSKIPR